MLGWLGRQDELTKISLDVEGVISLGVKHPSIFNFISLAYLSLVTSGLLLLHAKCQFRGLKNRLSSSISMISQQNSTTLNLTADRICIMSCTNYGVKGTMDTVCSYSAKFLVGGHDPFRIRHRNCQKKHYLPNVNKRMSNITNGFAVASDVTETLGACRSSLRLGHHLISTSTNTRKLFS